MSKIIDEFGRIRMERIRAASWQSRFWAWIIDELLVSIPWYLIMFAFGLDATSFLGLGYYGAMAFLYWTVLEGYRGQSLGKMVLSLVVIGQLGECISFKDAAIESFGKAFLLPLDCLVGWAALPGRGQRLFNKISDTVVASLDQEGTCTFMNRKK
jgi:RDD family